MATRGRFRGTPFVPRTYLSGETYPRERHPDDDWGVEHSAMWAEFRLPDSTHYKPRDPAAPHVTFLEKPHPKGQATRTNADRENAGFLPPRHRLLEITRCNSTAAKAQEIACADRTRTESQEISHTDVTFFPVLTEGSFVQISEQDLDKYQPKVLPRVTEAYRKTSKSCGSGMEKGMRQVKTVLRQGWHSVTSLCGNAKSSLQSRFASVDRSPRNNLLIVDSDETLDRTSDQRHVAYDGGETDDSFTKDDLHIWSQHEGISR